MFMCTGVDSMEQMKQLPPTLDLQKGYVTFPNYADASFYCGVGSQ